MKIGIILISGGFGGAERTVYNLVKNLSKYKDNDISLIINEEIIKYYKNIKRIKLHSLGFTKKDNRLSNLINFYFLIKKVNNLFKRYNLDILLSNLELPNFISPIIKNHIHVFHGTDIKYLENSPSLSHHLIILPRLKRSLNKSKFIVSVSKHQIQNLKEKYKKKTIVIPNGVDSDVFKPLNKIKQKKNVILFAGRFIDIKGINEIISVAKQLPQYEFWFAGQGPLENLINLSNTKNLGFKTTEELVKLYNQANICIFPSYREGLPLCGLEAMSCGRAVIATPLGFSEYIKNGKDGMIIPAKDEKALKDAIVDLMTNEKKRKIIEKNARKKALNYSWDNVAKQYMKVFKEVLKKSEKE